MQHERGSAPRRNLVDIVVYSGLAHSNPQKTAIFEDWENSGFMGFVWADFFAAMRDLMSALKHLRTLNEQVQTVANPKPAEGARRMLMRKFECPLWATSRLSVVR